MQKLTSCIHEVMPPWNKSCSLLFHWKPFEIRLNNITIDGCCSGTVKQGMIGWSLHVLVDREQPFLLRSINVDFVHALETS